MLDYKVWQNGLQSALGITKSGRVDYKVWQGLQSVAGLKKELVQKSQKTNALADRLIERASSMLDLIASCKEKELRHWPK